MPSAARVAELLLEQAGHCAALGSPLYGRLLEAAGRDAAAGGPTFALLRDDPAPGPRGDALGLRLLAAAHRLALQGRAPELAAFLPSTGGTSGDGEGAAQALLALIATGSEELRPLVALPCQTNEVGRAAALSYGFFEAAESGLPLRLLEVGASAGLNLRFDHFRFEGGGAAFGPPESPVALRGLWLDAPPLPRSLAVRERAGCDRRPVDPGTEEGRLSLLASVWADQVPRFARLRGALQIASRVPASLERADVAEWAAARLAEAHPGLATVVYHSIVDEYLPSPTRRAFHETLREAGARARPEAPLFWLRLEPFPEQRVFGVALTAWPGGGERLLATSGPHGDEVRRA